MTTYDLIVIGAGPGGYVAAIRAAQLGLRVACIDREKELGGTCVRVGCIPSKAMLESSERFEALAHLGVHGITVKHAAFDLAAMLERKRQVVAANTAGVAFLFKKNKITSITGTARFNKDKSLTVTAEKGEQQLSAPHVIIATGSKPATLPGVNLADDRIDTSTEALEYTEVPKHLAVIGAGYIGLEMASIWRRLGAKVTVVEYLDRILPGMEKQLAHEAQKIFTKQGLEFKLKSRVTGVAPGSSGKSVVVNLDGANPVEADRCLVAVGRSPNTEGLGLDDLHVQRTDRGFIQVDHDFKTNVPGVYAIGDVIPTPMLAHVAEDEGVACVEKIVTGQGHVNYDAIPGVVYTHPEIATVGKTESQLLDADHPYVTGVFQFRGNGRARAMEETAGFVKVIADKKTDRVLGVHILGPRAGDLIAECVGAMEFGASSEDIARTCHAHPTLAEAVKEAALAVQGRAIHA